MTFKEALKKTELGIEIWKDVPSHIGVYKVSNFGRVKRLKESYPKPPVQDNIFNPCPNKQSGYVNIAAKSHSGKWETLKIHRWEAQAFIPNPENKPHVNHINSCPHDNTLTNLEWCTHAENMRHGYKYGFNKGLVGSDNPTSRTVINCRSEVFTTIKEASDKYKTHVSSIGRVCRGERVYSGKYPDGETIKWRYL